MAPFSADAETFTHVQKLYIRLSAPGDTGSPRFEFGEPLLACSRTAKAFPAIGGFLPPFACEVARAAETRQRRVSPLNIYIYIPLSLTSSLAMWVTVYSHPPFPCVFCI